MKDNKNTKFENMKSFFNCFDKGFGENKICKLIYNNIFYENLKFYNKNMNLTFKRLNKNAIIDKTCNSPTSCNYEKLLSRAKAACILISNSLNKPLQIVLCHTSYVTTAIFLIVASALGINITITDLSFLEFNKIQKSSNNNDTQYSKKAVLANKYKDYCMNKSFEGSHVDHLNLETANCVLNDTKLSQNIKTFVVEGDTNELCMTSENIGMNYFFEQELIVTLEGIISSFNYTKSSSIEETRLKILLPIQNIDSIQYPSISSNCLNNTENSKKAEENINQKCIQDIYISFCFKAEGNKIVTYSEQSILHSCNLFNQNINLESKSIIACVAKNHQENIIICGLLSPLFLNAQCSFVTPKDFEKYALNIKPTILLCNNNYAKYVLADLNKTSGKATKKIYESNYTYKEKNNFLSLIGKTKLAIRRFIRIRALYNFGGNIKKIISIGELSDIYVKMFLYYGIYTVSMIDFYGACPFAFRFLGDKKGFWHTADGRNADLTEVHRDGMGRIVMYGNHICENIISSDKKYSYSNIKNNSFLTNNIHTLKWRNNDKKLINKDSHKILNYHSNDSKNLFINTIISEDSFERQVQPKDNKRQFTTNLIGFVLTKGVIFISNSQNYAKIL